jgi:hypothetical protein
MDLKISACIGAMAVAGALSTEPALAKSPDCKAWSVKQTVLGLAQKKAPLPERFSYVLDDIKVVESKDDAASCAADLMRVYRESSVYQSTHITYTVTRNRDGELYISVEHLPR